MEESQGGQILSENERITIALEEISKSLSVLEEDTKAKIRQEEFEKIEKVFITRGINEPSQYENYIWIFILGIVVGCMLFPLGTELLKWLTA